MKKIRLFCFPYAGGSAAVYLQWKDFLDKSIHLYPVELAGRGQRIGQPLYHSLEEAVDDIFGQIRFDLLHLPYAFYGHSMGTLLAYHLSLKIRQKSYPGPAHVFFSGRGAPHIRRPDKQPYHDLPHDEFRQKVMDLGGTPKEFFQVPELMEALLPMLRNDFRLTWEYRVDAHNISPLNCDISILTGNDDDLTPRQIDEWKQYTRYNSRFHTFEGGHFFLHSPGPKQEIMQLLNHTLVELGRRRIAMTP